MNLGYTSVNKLRILGGKAQNYLFYNGFVALPHETDQLGRSESKVKEKASNSEVMIKQVINLLACVFFSAVTLAPVQCMAANVTQLKPLPAKQSEPEACVILLHGLARTAKSMNKLAAALKQNNYFVVNQGYPSRKYPIEKLAHIALPKALAKCEPHPVLHVVTHSMGAILLRYYLKGQAIDTLQRVVMLGPPNQGSQVVDKLCNVPGFRLLNGPAGLQLGTQTNSIPKQLGPAVGEVGIIAGSRSINWVLSQYLPNPDDGKVSVENTKLVGMKDHLVLKVSHPFLMSNQQAIAQVSYFLQHGKFKRAEVKNNNNPF